MTDYSFQFSSFDELKKIFNGEIVLNCVVKLISKSHLNLHRYSILVRLLVFYHFNMSKAEVRPLIVTLEAVFE